MRYVGTVCNPVVQRNRLRRTRCQLDPQTNASSNDAQAIYPLRHKNSVHSVTETSSRRLPGVSGVWVFIAADMMVFGALFASFVFDRLKHVDLFNSSQQALDFNYGGINTLILLTSSWFVVLAVHAAKSDRLKQLPYLLALAVLCGGAFGALKIFEYSAKLGVGITMMTNDFYMYYFTLTSIHLLHVIGGMVVLVVLWKKSRAGSYNSTNYIGLEMGASFWHMVDLLWIVIFPLLYLLR